MKKTIVVIWFIAVSVPITYLMGMHTLSLRSSKNENLSKLVGNNKWTKLHFLGADCKCSEKIFDELLKRKPSSEDDEKIYIIGKNEKWQKSLKDKGYIVFSDTMDKFEKSFSISATPQLVILSDKKKILYSGGYSAMRNPTSIEDEKIISALKGHKNEMERPIFGCVSGTINRKNSDPFKLKY